MSEPNEPTGSTHPSTGAASRSDTPASSSRLSRLLGRTPQQRFVFVLVGLAAVLSLGVGVGLYAAHRAGEIVIQVNGHGDDVRVRMPAAFGHVALALLPERAFACERHGGLRRGEIGVLVKALESIPDGTVLVQVDSAREHVRMSRERGRFLIHVDSDDEQVRVEVPVRLAGAFLRKADRMAREG